MGGLLDVSLISFGRSFRCDRPESGELANGSGSLHSFPLAKGQEFSFG